MTNYYYLVYIYTADKIYDYTAWKIKFKIFIIIEMKQELASRVLF
jgi:hypothetical protein